MVTRRLKKPVSAIFFLKPTLALSRAPDPLKKPFVSLFFLFFLFLFSCAPASYYRSKPAQPKAQQSRLQEEAERWLGTPYRYGGNDLSGIDCSGLVCRIYERVYGRSLPRQAKLQRKLGRSVALPYLKPGDLLFFRFNGTGGINHVGIYLGQGRFIHASTERGVVISELTDKYYRRHLVVARRILR